MSEQGKILVVDDERSMQEFLQILLERSNYQVQTSSGTRKVFDLLEADDYDLVLTDLKMPEISGLELLSHVKEHNPATEIIIMTAYATTETAVAAMKKGAYDYLIKPFKVDEVLVTIERALEKRRLIRDNALLRRELRDRYRMEELVGKSKIMQNVFEVVRKVANTKTSVLITGESGTGKELVARAIHNLSDRSDRPFIPVNCGAIPANLVESELFGHVKGAFTGASHHKEGLFSAANSGTIFLDEIGELDLSIQVKLLRALQEHMIKPVGGVHERAVNVRVIAATNRDLQAAVDQGSFRADLFYRLNVIPLPLPPLRERREDIPLIAMDLAKKIGHEVGRSIEGFTQDALNALKGYNYPGNVRELENIIQRAVALAATSTIDLAALPDLDPRRGQSSSGGLDVLPEKGLDLDAHIGGIERKLLLQALKQTQGNRTEAAALVGMTLRSLRYRLAKYGLD